MKLMHLSDLHLGKRLNEISLYDDQKYILQQLVKLAQQHKPDAILIAGDIYDKSVPAAEAVSLFDAFLNQLAEINFPVYIISGNHDSAERLAFGAQLMQKSRVHIASAYTGQVQKFVFQDEYGTVHIFLLPFLKPALVKHYLPEEEADKINSYHDALQAAVTQLSLDKKERNVLVAHQFVTGAISAGSETVNVGGLDNIGAEVFADFDYVALGHIHNPQNVAGNKHIRYCGTPLKYSFAEWQQQKSVTFVELGAKGSLQLELVPLQPLHELRHLRGTYQELIKKENYQDYPIDEDGCLHDFYYITLTDEDDVPNALQNLRSVYKNILQLDYDNQRTRTDNALEVESEPEEKTPLELIDSFFEQQNNQPMSEQQKAYVMKLLDKLGGEAV